MKPKIFVVVLVFVLFGFCSCSNLADSNNYNIINFEVDFNKMASYQNESLINISANNYQVEAILYRVKKSSLDNPLNESNLTKIEKCISKLDNKGKANISFDNVFIGIQVVIFVNLYEISNTNEKKLSYSGNSNIFKVKRSVNNIHIKLKKVQTLQIHTVTFDLAGGSFENGETSLSVQVEHGKPVSVPSESPVLDEYIFDYWYIMNDDGSFQKYDFSKPITSNLIIYAKWEIYLTATSVIPYIEGLTTEGPHNVVVRGEITDTDITNIRNVIKSNENAYINLDLSKTIGITTLASEAFNNCSRLTSIILPEGLTSINSYAFYNCLGLTSVIFPKSLISISTSAFAICKNLTSIILPEGFLWIGHGVFQHCTNLTYVQLPETIQSIAASAFYWCKNLTNFYIPSKLASISEGTFESCYKLTTFEVSELNEYFSTSDDKKMLLSYDKTTLSHYPSATGKITIPEGVTTIGKSAFKATYVEEVVFTEGLTTIESSAFKYCEDIKTLNFPESLTSVDSYAFTDCSDLQTILVSSYAPKSTVFNNCDDFEVVIKDGVTTISDEMFSDYTMKSVSIPDSVTSIGDSAFSGCDNLTNVTIPDSVTSIGSGAFSGCSNLEIINIPSHITVLSESLFSGCEKLANFEISTNVTAIGNFTFSGCESFTSITIPESVTSIGSGVFSGCYNLEKINIPSSITVLGESLFSGCEKLTSFEIPETITSIGSYAFSFSGLTNIKIPEGVTSIGDSAFEYAKLTSVEIPSSVTYIGKTAFYGCRIPSITVPSAVSKIGLEAFDSSYITSLTFGKPYDWYYTYNEDFTNGYKFNYGFTENPVENATIYKEWISQYFYRQE